MRALDYRGYACTANKRDFLSKYRESAPERSNIRSLHENCHLRSDHLYIGGNGHPQICNEYK